MLERFKLGRPETFSEIGSINNNHFSRTFQDCIPMRFVAFHVVNAPFIFNAFFTAMKPFMREGFKSKVSRLPLGQGKVSST